MSLEILMTARKKSYLKCCRKRSDTQHDDTYYYDVLSKTTLNDTQHFNTERPVNISKLTSAMLNTTTHYITVVIIMTFDIYTQV